MNQFVNPSELEGQDIPDYDGLPVTSTKAVLRKCGDGLSESMAMAQMHVPAESRILVLVYATAKDHRYKRCVVGRGDDKEILEEFEETLYLDADGALFLDPDLVGEIVTAHTERVNAERAKAEEEKRTARGEPPLPLGGEGE